MYFTHHRDLAWMIEFFFSSSSTFYQSQDLVGCMCFAFYLGGWGFVMI